MATVAYISGLSSRVVLGIEQRTRAVRERGIERVGDPVDLAGEDLVGIGDDLDADGGATPDACQIHLEHVREHPDRVELAHGEQLDRRAARVLALHLGPGFTLRAMTSPSMARAA